MRLPQQLNCVFLGRKSVQRSSTHWTSEPPIRSCAATSGPHNSRWGTYRNAVSSPGVTRVNVVDVFNPLAATSNAQKQWSCPVWMTIPAKTASYSRSFSPTSGKFSSGGRLLGAVTGRGRMRSLPYAGATWSLNNPIKRPPEQKRCESYCNEHERRTTSERAAASDEAGTLPFISHQRSKLTARPTTSLAILILGSCTGSDTAFALITW